MNLFGRWTGRKAIPAREPVNPETTEVAAVIRLFENLRVHTEVQDVCQTLADTLVAEFGFRAATVRILNLRTRLFEPRSFSGCTPAELARLSTIDVSELSPPDAGVFPTVRDRTTLIIDLRGATVESSEDS